MKYVILSLFISLAHAGTDFSKLHFLDGCTIYTLEKIELALPGSFCLFLDDGTVFSASNNIRRINKDKSIAWDLPGNFHHQMNLSIDKKRILAIGFEIVTVEGTKYRDDVLYVIDLDGKVLNRRDLTSIYKESGIRMISNVEEMAINAGASAERSHFNSIHEMPDGKIIANSLHLGFFIFSPDLSKILYHKKFEPRHRLHDVQMSFNGNLIFFRNLGKDTSPPYSSIEEFDMKNDKINWSYTPKPIGILFSPLRGSVQEIDKDLIFFNDLKHGGFFYSRKKKTVVRSVPGKFGKPGTNDFFHQIKVIDAEKFLKNFR